MDPAERGVHDSMQGMLECNFNSRVSIWYHGYFLFTYNTDYENSGVALLVSK